MPSGFIASTMFLGVRAAARVVVDLGADRVAHAAAKSFGDDLGMADFDAGRLGRAEQVPPPARV